MAKIRITRELLEHLLDLPADVSIVTSPISWVFTRGHQFLAVLEVDGNPEMFTAGREATYALQYEETDLGTSLVSAIPVPD